MSHHSENQDLRQTERGGWSWAENELGTVFAPIIGPVGCWVYQAMCALVPLAGKYSNKQVTVRSVSDYASVAKSTVDRELKKLIAVGMIIKTEHLFGQATYKLPSLRDLAKLGEAELLKRAGVPAGDTAPFDQRVANKREKAARLERRRVQEEKDGRERVLPLYAQEKPAPDHDQVSVPPRDTTSAGVSFDRAEDVVSQGGPNGVPSYGTQASQGGTPLKSKDLQENTITPLPPTALASPTALESGVRFEAERLGSAVAENGPGSPVLAEPNITASHAKFLVSLPIASAWVLTQIGSSRQRHTWAISAQLKLYCQRHPNESLQAAAAKMAHACDQLWKQAHLLRHKPWGWEKFIGDAHWLRPLPYASQSMSREAGVGTYRPDPEAEQRKAEAHRDRVREYISGRAAKIIGIGVLEPVAEELELLAAGVDADTAVDELDIKLSELEDRMFERLLATYAAEEIAKLDAATEAACAKRNLNLFSAQQKDNIRQGERRRIVFETYDLPKFSLFYMPQP